MIDLRFHLFDEAARDRIEVLFWKHAQRLLRMGQSVSLRPASGCTRTEMRSASAPERSASRSSSTSSTCRTTSDGVGSELATTTRCGRLRRSPEINQPSGTDTSRPRLG
jgi:hypothetical protein